jgi:enoyl-CoA hydratase/carnithine racemase
MARAMDLARAIAGSAPFAVRETKRLVRAGLGLDAHAHAHAESYAQAQSLATADAAEGIAALLEKREPRFQGR